MLSASAFANLAVVTGAFQGLLESTSKDTKSMTSSWYNAWSHCSTTAKASASVIRPPNFMMILDNTKSRRHLSIIHKNIFTNRFSVNTPPNSLTNLAYMVRGVSFFHRLKSCMRCIWSRWEPLYSSCRHSSNIRNGSKSGEASKEAKIVWVAWA